jgi:two-component system cell cycle sensor histidine kinase/response regulator CckA
MQGPDLVRRVRAKLPALPVLFVTGFSAGLEGLADMAGVRVVEKPFDAAVLGVAVRAVLDAGR